MTAHDFAVSVLQWLIVVSAILGVAMALERVFERPRRRSRYFMAYDVHDDRRRAERSGFKSRIGTK